MFNLPDATQSTEVITWSYHDDQLADVSVPEGHIWAEVQAAHAARRILAYGVPREIINYLACAVAEQAAVFASHAAERQTREEFGDGGLHEGIVDDEDLDELSETFGGAVYAGAMFARVLPTSKRRNWLALLEADEPQDAA
jgi:hypothetical protein